VLGRVLFGVGGVQVDLLVLNGRRDQGQHEEQHRVVPQRGQLQGGAHPAVLEVQHVGTSEIYSVKSFTFSVFFCFLVIYGHCIMMK